MSKTSRTTPSTPRKRTPKPKPVIPEPFQVIGASLVRAGDVTVKVPMLVLRGEWLRRCGFPIDACAYVTPDKRGELTLHRLGLSVPRRIRITAVKR